MSVRIQIRRDSSANWETNNPTLAHGEPAWDYTLNALKIGDGATAWNSLGFLVNATSLAATTTRLETLHGDYQYLLTEDELILNTEAGENLEYEVEAPDVDYNLGTEDGNYLTTEDGYEITFRSTPTQALLTEAGENIGTEDGIFYLET